MGKEVGIFPVAEGQLTLLGLGTLALSLDLDLKTVKLRNSHFGFF